MKSTHEAPLSAQPSALPPDAGTGLEPATAAKLPVVTGPMRRVWVEVEPGAMLPPEAPPWAERHALVKRGELPDALRRPTLGVAVALLAGAAALVMTGELRGYAAVPVGLALLWAGLTGGVRRDAFVPSPEGRWVAIEGPPEPEDPAAVEAVRKAGRRFDIVAGVFFAAILGVAYWAGVLDLRTMMLLLGALAVGAVPSLLEVAKSRTEPEAPVSERFLQASDPRQPLPESSPPGAPRPPSHLPG
jgi:hypothetical protein